MTETHKAVPPAGPGKVRMPRFFPRVQPEAIGLALFLNAGDPSLEHLEDLVIFLDNAGVDCLELAVPFQLN